MSIRQSQRKPGFVQISSQPEKPAALDEKKTRCQPADVVWEISQVT